MAIPEAMNAEEIFRRYQESLKSFGPNTRHYTTSPLALYEDLCPM
jgi:hypothetical protein